MKPLRNILAGILVSACSMAMAGDENSPSRQAITEALHRLPDDPELAFETSGGLSVAFYALYGQELKKAVANLPEGEGAPLLERLIDPAHTVRTAFIIRTFRELKLPMSEKTIRTLQRLAKDIEKFTEKEALGNELFLYLDTRRQRQ